MKQKRIATLILTAVMTVGLAACGGASDQTGSSAGESAAAASANAQSEAAASSGAAEQEAGESEAARASSSEGYGMTMIMANRDEYKTTLEEAALEAAEAMGIQMTSQDANNDQAKQIQIIEAAVNGGDDAVLVNLVDADTGEACIEAAQGKPIIFFTRPPADPCMVDAFENAGVVASNEDLSGYYQGEALANYFNEKGKTEIRYLLLQGELGNYATIHRTSSVLQALEDGGITATNAAAPLVADWDRATALDMIAPLLTSEEYDCIIANNDAMALGAIEAMEAAGIDPSTIPVVGIDATVDGRQAIRDGKLFMTVFQNPVGQGEGSIRAAINMIEGRPLNDGTGFELSEETDHIVWVPFEPVTAENVEEYER